MKKFVNLNITKSRRKIRFRSCGKMNSVGMLRQPVATGGKLLQLSIRILGYIIIYIYPKNPVEERRTMDKLEIKAYTRAELQEIFHSGRTDVYRSRLNRAGYTFESAGRG